MITATATLRSISPYSQSRAHITPHLEKEGHDDFETRTWREKLHVNDTGEVYIPHSAFKNALSEAAKYLSLQIPGKGKSTYTKHFEAGVMVLTPTPIGIRKEDVECERLFLPSDGIRGSGKRVWKNMPFIPAWRGEVQFVILDETITQPVFQKVLDTAGSLIGIGRYRPRNNGIYGRFVVDALDWADDRKMAA